MREYTLIVKGNHIPVTQAVYKAYYQECEHERYLKKKSVRHEHSWEQLVEAGVSIVFTAPTVKVLLRICWQLRSGCVSYMNACQNCR